MAENRKEIGPYDYIEHFKGNTALLVSMDKNESLNVMALDWKTIEEFEGIHVIRAQVAYSRYTYKLLTGFRLFYKQGFDNPHFQETIDDKKTADQSP